MAKPRERTASATLSARSGVMVRSSTINLESSQHPFRASVGTYDPAACAALCQSKCCAIGPRRALCLHPVEIMAYGSGTETLFELRKAFVQYFAILLS